MLARGPRFRLDAEMVRDSALAAAGLLVEELGGPPVYPPQPAGVTAAAYGNVQWTPSVGRDRVRRSLYTFTKRTAPFAAFAVFDAPSGEQCVVARGRSDTPLQSLTLLNDAMFLETARALGTAAVKEFAGDRDRAAAVLRRAFTRPATAAEVDAVAAFAADQRSRFRGGDLDPAALLHGPPGGDAADLAAWTLAARAVLNADGALVKP